MIYKNSGDQPYRENVCVVCGSTEDLTRHHLIPACYISKLIAEVHAVVKQDYEHDFCCVCRKCHEKYDTLYTNDLYSRIHEKYGVVLSETSYKQPRSNKPKPSEVVARQIDSPESYFMLRDFCIQHFIDCMKPGRGRPLRIFDGLEVA